MQAAVGETAFPHPLSIARLVFPNNEECTTPPHQDYPNNQGTRALNACWMPLMDCPTKLGTLAILPGSQNLGLMPLDFSLGAGGRQAVLSEAAQALHWHTSDFELGDALIFNSMTLHTALPNCSDKQFRLSVDYRFQQEDKALTEMVLSPHFDRLSWEEIYSGWKSSALKYYWRHKRYHIADWDSSIHILPEGHMHEAVRQTLIYDQRRKRMRKARDDKHS